MLSFIQEADIFVKLEILKQVQDDGSLNEISRHYYDPQKPDNFFPNCNPINNSHKYS